MPGYAALENKRNELIRKGIQGSVFIAPITADAIDASVLFDATTGAIKTLPAGYQDLGWTTDTGAVFARKVTSTDILGWGSNDPVRSDITADVTTIAVDAEETNLLTLALGANVAQSSITPGTNGVVSVPHPSAPVARYYRLYAVLADSGDGGEIIISKFFPRVQVSSYTSQSYANGKDALLWGFVFTAYQDSTLGYAQADIHGGPGYLYLLDDMDYTHVVTCTVALTTALVATVGTFSAGDVGRELSGAGITPGTTIASFTDSTHVVMSAVGTAAASGVAVTVGP